MSRFHPIRQNIDAFLVRHSQFQAAEAEIENLIAAGRSSGEAECLMVTGPAGTGKTTLRKLIARSHLPEGGGQRPKTKHPALNVVANHVPVIVIEMAPQPRPRRLLRDILQALGDPRWDKGRLDDMSDKLDHFLSLSGTVTIVIDEVQRLVDRAGILTSEAVLEELKRLHGKHGISLVFLGLGRMRSIFDQDVQLRDRWSVEVRLEPFRCYFRETRNGSTVLERDEKQWLEWRGVLRLLQEVADIPSVTPLSDPDWAKRLFVATQGVMRRLKRLIKRALVELDRAGQDRLDLPELARAFEAKDEQSFNPFLPEFPDDFDVQPVDDDKRSLRKPKRREGRPTSCGNAGSHIAKFMSAVG